MSRVLSELLGAKEPLFSLSLQQLERISGDPGADVRLTAEIIGRVRLKTKELGLDPDDTTGKELYYALITQVEKHDAYLAKLIGGNDPEDVHDLLPRIKKRIEQLDINKSCWVLKKSIAKQMLKKMPPKNIMAHLHYRSVDSMLKNEKLAEIYGALRFAESSEWLNAFNESYKKLKPSDFETRKIEIVEMPMERWGNIAAPFVHKKRHNITYLKELGIIVMLPIGRDRLRGLCITVMPLLIHYINEVRLYSAFFKLQQVKPNFGKIVAETLITDTGKAVNMAGENIHWRVIQRYFGKRKNEHHPEIFEPHVQPEDLHWRKTEEILYEMAPKLEFWRDLDYVGVMHGKRPVTFNLIDTAVAYCHNTPYSDRIIYHFRESLWNEIFVRYMGQKVLEKQILQQLDNDLIKPEELMVV